MNDPDSHSPINPSAIEDVHAPDRDSTKRIAITLLAAIPSVLMAGPVVEQTPSMARPTFTVGVGTHLRHSKDEIEKGLRVMKEAGISSFREDVPWKQVEQTEGQLAIPSQWDAYVDQAIQLGIEPLLILDYGNRFYDGGDKPLSERAMQGFVRYCEFVVRHFKGRVRQYEIWNEWDAALGHTTPGSAADYVRLAQRVYPAIKGIDPGITVLAGAVTFEAMLGSRVDRVLGAVGVHTRWLDELIAAGVLRYADGLSLHPYVYKHPHIDKRTPEAWAHWLDEIQTDLRSHHQGRTVPLYITELGWPTHKAPMGVTAERAADYLPRMLLLARTLPYVKGVWWYDLRDDGWDERNGEHNYGLLRPDLRPKPAYASLLAVADLAGRAEYLGRYETGDPALWILRFRASSGDEVWALWYTGTAARHIVLSYPAPEIRLTEVRRLGDRAVEHRCLPAPGPVVCHLPLTIEGTPWFLKGRLQNLDVALQ